MLPPNSAGQIERWVPRSPRDAPMPSQEGMKLFYTL